MFLLHEMCSEYGTQPSESFGIQDAWLAYDFNNAVYMYGRWVNNKLQERDRKGKPKWTLQQVLEGNTNFYGGGLFSQILAAGGDAKL